MAASRTTVNLHLHGIHEGKKKSYAVKSGKGREGGVTSVPCSWLIGGRWTPPNPAVVLARLIRRLVRVLPATCCGDALAQV